MKPSSFYLIALASVWIMLCSALSSDNRLAAARYRDTKDAHYYFYLASNDTFDAYNTLADEIVRQESITGVYVNTNPFGGTLVVRGYLNNNVPHTIWPSCALFAHY